MQNDNSKLKIYKNYEILEHTADLKIRAYGKNLKELFSNMLKGMFEGCQPELEDRKPIIRDIQVKSENLQSLLVDFLSEALYLSDVNNEVYFEVKFKALTNKELKGKIKGKKFEKLSTEIKAVTWHDLEIEKRDRLWTATVLFDM